MARLPRVPKLCHHRHVEQAYVTVEGKAKYLGKWPRNQVHPPRDVQRAYELFVAALMRARAEAKAGVPIKIKQPTVLELYNAYLKHAKTYYVKGGLETSEVSVIRGVCGLVAAMFGQKPANELTAMDLERVRAAMVAKQFTRKSINSQIQRVRVWYRWAVSKSLVPVSVLDELATLMPLKKGRTSAPEATRVKPIAWADVEAVVSRMREPFADMCRVHWLLGCRAQDVVRMTPAEIHVDERGWRYEPATFKTEHHEGIDQLVYWLGPECRTIIERRMRGRKPNDPIFPAFRRHLGNKRKGFGQDTAYSAHSYGRAIARACKQQGAKHWSPIQIRKGRLTEIRRQFGIEGSQAVAMHANVSTTELYAHKSEALARQIMEAMG